MLLNKKSLYILFLLILGSGLARAGNNTMPDLPGTGVQWAVLDHNKRIEDKVLALADQLVEHALLAQSMPSSQPESYRVSSKRRDFSGAAQKRAEFEALLWSLSSGDQYINFWTKHASSFLADSTGSFWLMIAAVPGGILSGVVTGRGEVGVATAAGLVIAGGADIFLVNGVLNAYGKLAAARSRKILRHLFFGRVFQRLKEQGISVPLFRKEKWLDDLIGFKKNCVKPLSSTPLLEADTKKAVGVWAGPESPEVSEPATKTFPRF